MEKLNFRRFKDKDTEKFYNGEKVLKFQAITRDDKQQAYRKLVLVVIAKSWKEIELYFPSGASGSRLEKLKGSKNQHSIRLNIQYRLLFSWDKEQNQTYDIVINKHDKSYGK